MPRGGPRPNSGRKPKDRKPRLILMSDATYAALQSMRQPKQSLPDVIEMLAFKK